MRLLPVASAALAIALAAWLLVPDAISEPARRYPRGMQRCHADCQSWKTDCITACDGDTECELACQRRAEVCTDRCEGKGGGDAGADGAAGAPGDAGGPDDGDAPVVDAGPDAP